MALPIFDFFPVLESVSPSVSFCRAKQTKKSEIGFGTFLSKHAIPALTFTTRNFFQNIMIHASLKSSSLIRRYQFFFISDDWFTIG